MIAIEVVIVVRQFILDHPSESHEVVFKLSRLWVWVQFGQKQNKAEEMDGVFCSIGHAVLAGAFGVEEKKDVFLEDGDEVRTVPEGIVEFIYQGQGFCKMQKFDKKLFDETLVHGLVECKITFDIFVVKLVNNKLSSTKLSKHLVVKGVQKRYKFALIRRQSGLVISVQSHSFDIWTYIADIQQKLSFVVGQPFPHRSFMCYFVKIEMSYWHLRFVLFWLDEGDKGEVALLIGLFWHLCGKGGGEEGANCLVGVGVVEDVEQGAVFCWNGANFVEKGSVLVLLKGGVVGTVGQQVEQNNENLLIVILCISFGIVKGDVVGEGILSSKFEVYVLMLIDGPGVSISGDFNSDVDLFGLSSFWHFEGWAFFLLAFWYLVDCVLSVGLFEFVFLFVVLGALVFSVLKNQGDWFWI